MGYRQVNCNFLSSFFMNSKKLTECIFRAMELGRECMALWGYEYIDELVWVKTNQLQRIIRTGRTGHWLNHGKEHCLVSIHLSCKAAFTSECEQNTNTRHAKMMRTFDVDVFLRRGKQHSSVWRTFSKQPNAIRRLSVHQREFAYNTFM